MQRPRLFENKFRKEDKNKIKPTKTNKHRNLEIRRNSFYFGAKSRCKPKSYNDERNYRLQAQKHLLQLNERPTIVQES